MAISKIEIFGTPAPTITSSAGTDICISSQTKLHLSQSYDSAAYQWQQSTNGGTTWTNIASATDSTYLLTVTDSGSAYQYRVQVTYRASAFTSNAVTINAVSCCPAGYSSQTVYYNDFGTFDLINDNTGKTYYLWDYSNYNSPVQVKYTTATPFQYPLATAPIGATFISKGPIDTDEYTVSAGFNGYQNYTYTANGVTYAPTSTSDLQWAADIGGYTSQPAVTFDHSGTFNGAALLINMPANSMGNIILSDTINNLCGSSTLFFESYINVFTSSAPGTYYPVNVLLKLIDPVTGTATTSTATATAQGQTLIGTSNTGCTCWVRLTGGITIDASSTSMVFQLIQNQNDNANGDDLVLDDIKVYACAAPGSSCLTGATQVTAAVTNSQQQLLFPNPSTGIVSLNYSQPAMGDVTIISSTGKVVATQNSVSLNSATFDLSSLPKGLYFVQINSGGTVVTQKLALE